MDHLFEIQENLPHLKIVSGETKFFDIWGKLLKGFKILCSDFDHILKKRRKLFKGGDIIQGRILIKEIRYVALYSKKSN